MNVTIFDPGNFVPHYVASLRCALARRGNPSDLITSPPLFDAGTVTDESTHFLFFAWLTGRVRAALRRRPIMRRLLKAVTYPYGLFATYHLLRKREPGLLHAQWTPVPLLDAILLMAIRRRGWTIVATAHDPPPSNAIFRANLRVALALADAVIVHSRSQAEDLVAIYPELAMKVEVIPHGAVAIDPPTLVEKIKHREALGLPAKCRLILFFGMIKRYKGLSFLLDAMPAVIERFPDVQLLVAGEPFYPVAEIERRIHDLDLTKHVTLHAGYVRTSEVSRYLRAADALVAPYVGGGASGVVLLAQSNAVPVICSASVGLRDLLEHGVTGLMAQAASSASLAGMMCHAFADTERFASMGREAWVRLQQENAWDIVAVKTMALYAAVCSEAPQLALTALAT